MSPQEALAALMAAKPDWSWSVDHELRSYGPPSFNVYGWRRGDTKAPIALYARRDLAACVAEALAQTAALEWDPYEEVA